jgi:hypothetical protein
MSRSTSRTGLGGVLAALALLGTAHAAPEASVPGATTEAVWKTQHITFVYRGYSTIYTCSGLHRTLERILVNVGAHDGIRLQSYHCDDHSGAARFELAIESPVEATPENVRELTTYDSREALIATVRGERLASAEDLPRFPAVWKTVSFARDRNMRLSPGDCELVQELRRQILPRMSVHIVTDRVRCSPGFGQIQPPQLTVSALVPAPPPVTIEQ